MLPRVIALLVICTLPCACTQWRVAELQPQQFSAEKSPGAVRLTLSDGTTLSARHPVILGDSLIWTDSSGAPRSDPARRAVPVSSIRRVETQRFNVVGTITSLVLVCVVAGGLILLAAGGLSGLGD